MLKNILLKSIVLTMFFIALSNVNKLIAQCGVSPSSGLVTITVTNNVVNTYYPGSSNALAGASSISVGSIDSRGSTTPLAVGDLILIIQIQGADIDASNTDSYGDNIVGAPASGYIATNLFAGYYEYNNVANVAGSTVTLSYSLANSYYNRDFSAGNAIQRFEVVRIPRYYDFTIAAGASVTAPEWDGSTGGIVVVDAANTFTLDGSIDLSSLGFRGGGGKNLTGAIAGNSNGSGTLTNVDYRFNSPVTNSANLSGGAKGEGIAGTPAYYFVNGTTVTTTATVEGYINGSMGWGAPGNAGGGGTDGSPVGANSENQYNSGGAGGGNGGAGGMGGSGWHGPSGNSTTYPTGGYGGSTFAQRSVQRFIFGGGGGAGTANNSLTSNEYNCSGGSGGGIILARAKGYAGSGSVNADGSNAPGVTIPFAPAQTDAAGGGGSGGTIVMVTSQAGPTGLNFITASAKGGKGGDMTTYFDHGPGGGGGGGVIISNGTFLLTSVLGGDNGKTRTGSTSGPIDNNYGATPGLAGVNISLSGPPVLANTNDLTSPCGVLPVGLTSFAARWNHNEVDLQWQITNEINLKSFDIEYSSDGVNFSTITSVAYRMGISAYLYAHLTPSLKNFYRLKMIDADGKYFYSRILSVQKLAGGNKIVLIYPNPAYSDVTLQVNSSNNEKIKVSLIDNSGRVVLQKFFTVFSGQNYLSLDGLDQLPTATYLLKVKSHTINEVQKLAIGQK